MKEIPSNPCPNNLTRRDLLKKAGGAGLTLAAAQALAPFLLSGYGWGKGGATADKAEGGVVKVGIMHSLSGFMKISEAALVDAEKMAIDEINASGGVLGKQIQPIVEDTKSEMDRGFPEKAKKLLTKDEVACVFGCWTSSSRKSVLPIFEKENGLLFYPVPYEGNECSKNVIYTGATPNQQIMPAIDYLVKVMGKKKLFLLGSNYVFPRMANQIVIAQLKAQYNLLPVGVDYADLTEKNFNSYVQKIKESKADAVFSTVNGDSNLPFYNEFAAQGLMAKDVPICAVGVGEDELRGIQNPEKLVGHLAAWNYFQSVDTPQNKEFVKKFKAKYGKDRVTADPIEAAYFQVYLWKLACEKAKSFEVDKVRAAIQDPKDPITFDAPGGMVKIDPANQHTWKPFRIGQIQEDRQFKILYESKDKDSKVEAIRPIPYPPVAYKKDCDWIKSPRKGEIEL